MVSSQMPPGTQKTAPVALISVVSAWIDGIDPPLGISETEQLLCSSGFNVGQIVVGGLILVSAYFFLKAVVRAVNREIRGGLYSLVAAVLPLFVPAFLTVTGIDTACLFPG